VIYFGPDGGPPSKKKNKIFFRALLFATSKRGRIVENMFVRLRREETRQNFNIWVYGDDALARGSGLFIGENGVACNHHFLLSEAVSDFAFRQGTYELTVFARLVGEPRQLQLFSVNLEVTNEIAAALQSPLNG